MIKIFGLALLFITTALMPWGVTASQVVADETVEKEDVVDFSKLSGISAGLCVIFEGGDVRATESLALSGKFLVHTLLADATLISAARKRMAEKGLAEVTSVELWAAPELPYEKNHVNLIVVSDFPALTLKGLSLVEIIRVLTPLGNACLGGVPEKEHAKLEELLKKEGILDFKWEEGGGQKWLVFKKPWIKEMGTWTHNMHAADGNLVANDTYMGVPNQIQWFTGVKRVQDEELHCKLVGGGRIFTFFRKTLIARDAGSGVVLWTKPLKKPVGGTAVLIGENIQMSNPTYGGYLGTSVLLSGATGEVIREGTERLGPGSLYEDGITFHTEPAFKAFDSKTGEKLWEITKSPELAYKKYQAKGTPFPYSMPGVVMSQGRIYYRNVAGELVILDAKTGNLISRKDLSKELGADFVIHFAFGDKVLLRSEIKEKQICEYSSTMVAPTEIWKGIARFTAVSGKDGSIAWIHNLQTVLVPIYKGQVFKAAGKIWLCRWGEPVYDEPVQNPLKTKDGKYARLCQDPQPAIWDGLDLETGKVVSSFEAPKMITFHCYRLNATDRYLTNNRPYYIIDWNTGKVEGRFGVLRPGCGAQGHLAAQGLFFGSGNYGCACIRTVISGQAAFSSDETSWDGAVAKAEHPVEMGTGKASSESSANAETDWPMFRNDMTRSSATKTSVPDGLEILWEKKLVNPFALADSPITTDWGLWVNGVDPITQPVVAGGRAFISLIDTKQVVALNVKTGEKEWSFDLPARIDTPPTIHKGLALVGCHDGWVYALRADTGELVWRTRVAPSEKRMVAYGQLESTWPVVGGVLVSGDTAYALAGRTTEVDGGLYLLALEPATGKVLWTGRRYLNNPGYIGATDSKRNEQLGTGAPDVLSSDGKIVIIGTRSARKGGFDCATGEDAGGYTAPKFSFNSEAMAFAGKTSYVATKYSKKTKMSSISLRGKWSAKFEGGSPRALVVAGDRIVVGVADEEKEDIKGNLWVVSSTDGAKLFSLPLSSAPTQDGIAVAGGQVFVTTQNGSIICLGTKK